MWFCRIVIFLLLIFFTGCNSQSPQSVIILESAISEEVKPPLPENQIHKIDSLLLRVLKRYRFNGNVLVALKGYPIFRCTRGYSNLYTKENLNINTVFQTASVSKGFTAMSVMMLKQRGLLDFEDTVKKYIPEFPYENITIKHLLQHTSGLSNYMYYVDHCWNRHEHITNEDVLVLINENSSSLNFRPGRKYSYSNTGYAILALLVERVSGKKFSVFLKENIFDALDMDDSFAWDTVSIDTSTNLAKGYKRRGWRYWQFNHDPLDEILGDKSVYSTIDDLLKWDQALYSDKLVSDSLLAEAFTPTLLRRNRKYNYGYGWRMKNRKNKRIIYHNGLWNGFTSSLTRNIDDSLTIIILNNTNAPVASIVRQIQSVLDKELKNQENIITKSEKPV